LDSLVASTSLTPNIIAHILACSNVVGRKDYGLMFAHTLTEEEERFVQKFRKDFTPTPPLSGGIYSNLLEQIPSYFPSENLKETIRSYDRLLEGLRGDLFEKDISPEEAKALNFWSPRKLRKWSIESLRGMFDEIEKNINRFKDILISCYTRFYEDHWTGVKPSLMDEAVQIRDSMEGLDVFGVWSEIIGKEFPYPKFVVYLCEARVGSTSLMAEKIAMPSTLSIELSRRIILHEIGVHFIGPGDYFHNCDKGRFFIENTERITRMEEAAICHFKPKVFSQLGLKLDEDWQANTMKLGNELTAFSRAWESGRCSNIIEAILEACNYSAA
jgi:hypothetical protein